MLDTLAQWETDQVLNQSDQNPAGFTAPARPAIRTLITDPWLVASGCPAGATHCNLDWTKAPFRLTAIVNRIDKRDLPDAQGNVADAGEGRFVFNAVDPNGTPLLFTLILEYELPARTSVDVFGWAYLWHSLSLFPFGSSGYNGTLQLITERFAGPNADPSRPNGSALNALRTNEVPLSPLGQDPTSNSTRLWEIRSFFIGSDGKMHLNTVAQTPALAFSGTPQLGDFLNANSASVLDGSYQVPHDWLDARAPTPSVFSWSAPNVTDPNVLHTFAIGTCSGCHRSETSTSFTHLGKRAAGQTVVVSNWLTTVEIPRRVADFKAVLDTDNLILAGNTAPFRIGRGH
jgi:hypothetical protein